jgi:hypothetical protein
MHQFSDGVNNYSTVQSWDAHCPVNDDDRFKKEQIVTLNVHGHDNHPTQHVWAWACVTYWGTDGGTCGGSVTSSGVGNYTLSPPKTGIFDLAHQGDFGYVLLGIPPRNGGDSPSTVRGIFTST